MASLTSAHNALVAKLKDEHAKELAAGKSGFELSIEEERMKKDQAVNARQVADLGRELYKRVSVMGSHALGVGRALEQAVGKYNQFVGSLESQVLTQARRFEDLKVDHEGRELPELSPLETAVRPLAKLTDDSEPSPHIRAVGEER